MENWIIRNPDFRTRITEMLSRQAFMHHIGFEITKIEAGLVEGSLEIQDIHYQQFGIIHGGVVTTLADIVAGFSAYTLVEAGQDVVTAEIKISCFRMGKGETIRAVGKVVKAGKAFSFVEADVFCKDGNEEIHVARATSTMAIVKRETKR